MSAANLMHDPQEDDHCFRSIIENARREAELGLADDAQGLGFCHLLWATQKRILKEMHGIDWRTPVEMNPGVMFD